MRKLTEIPFNTAKTILLISILVLLAAGCVNDDSDNSDPRTEGLYLWGEFALSQSAGAVYGHTTRPLTEYSSFRIVFSTPPPRDPEEGSLTMMLLREVDGEIQGAPCGPEAKYDPALDIFRGNFAPTAPGEWILQLAWNGLEEPGESYLALDVRQTQPYSRVLLHGTGFDREVIAWVAPKNPVIGLQPFRIRAWQTVSGMLLYQPDSLLNFGIKVEQTSISQPGSGNEPPHTVDGGLYEGVVNFSEPGGWSVTLLETSAEPPDSLVTFFFTL